MTRHLNLDEQADLQSVTTHIIADAAITAAKISTLENFNFTLDVSIGKNLIVLGGSNPDKRTYLSFPPGSLRPEYISTHTTDNFTFPNAVVAQTLSILAGPTTLTGDGLQPTLIVNSGDIDLTQHQARNFRIENRTTDPSVGHPGRVYWRTDLGQMFVDTGTSISPIGGATTPVTSIYADAYPPLEGNVQFVSGTGIVLTQTGQSITIDATAVATPPAGSNTQIQYNNFGVFGASSRFVFDPLGKVSLTAAPVNTAVLNLNSDSSGQVSYYDAAGSALFGYLYGSAAEMLLDSENQLRFVSGSTTPAPIILDARGGYVQLQTNSGANTWLFDNVGTLTLPGNIDASGYAFVNVADPIDPQDAATKAYVDSVSADLVPANFVMREIPSGAVNGVNTVFTLAFTPVLGKETVYLNGLQQDVGAANDYTISGPVITFMVAPEVTDKIRVSYIK